MSDMEAERQRYKRRLADMEPWKLVMTAFLSGAATVGALVIVLHLMGKL